MNPTHVSREFGRRLREARKAAGLTQEEFAAAARIAQAHLSKLERGHRLPDWWTMRSLKRVLGSERAAELLL